MCLRSSAFPKGIAPSGLQGLHAFHKSRSQFGRERALDFEGDCFARRVFQDEIDFGTGVGAVVAGFPQIQAFR